MKNCTIMFDFQNLAFRHFFINAVEGRTSEPQYGLWKYNVFNSIYQALYKVNNVDEVIIAVDDKQSWRKVYYPRYKEKRKLRRKQQDDVNWQELYNEISKFVLELIKYTPFKTLKVLNCEADDVIGVLTSELRNNKKVVVVSNDEDYLQLYGKNVELYHPTKQSIMEMKYKSPEEFIILKCLTGQSKDDIPNVKTPDDWGKTPETEGTRKPAMGPKTAKKVLDGGLEKWLNTKYVNEKYGEIDLMRNFKRNRVLMDFNFIPHIIKARINESYKSVGKPSIENLYKFFKMNGMRGFMEDYTRVEKKISELL